VATGDAILSALMLRWQECRQRGQTIAAEELCREHPELLEPLQRNLQAMAAMESLLRTHPETESQGATSDPYRMLPWTGPPRP
jgi:hypothetical protein